MTAVVKLASVTIPGQSYRFSQSMLAALIYLGNAPSYVFGDYLVMGAIVVAYSSTLNTTKVINDCLDVLWVCHTQWSLVDTAFDAHLTDAALSPCRLPIVPRHLQPQQQHSNCVASILAHVLFR